MLKVLSGEFDPEVRAEIGRVKTVVVGLPFTSAKPLTPAATREIEFG